MVKQTILSEADKSLITDAIKKAELSTSGEIVAIMTHQSDRYLADSLGIAIFLSFAAAVCLHHFKPVLGFDVLCMVQLALLIACAMFLDLTGCIARLVPRSQRRKAVARLAREQFFANGLQGAKDHAAIAILISFRERHVEIIADRGIDEKVKSGTWDSIAGALAGSIHGGAGAAIAQAVENCGVLLQAHCPAGDEQKNVFSDDVIVLP